ncbi:MAG: DNA-binding protein [Sulfuricellaceae bacterium]|nr:DNA-binding protein [Sulfuricellaceae bacterium]
MEARTLTISMQPNWQAALRHAAGDAFQANTYQGETLNFDSPAAFFSRLTERRWVLINALQGSGELPVRELARRVGRDVKRVHEDASVLVDLGLVERTSRGGLLCPFADIHVDMHLSQAA